MTQEVEVTAQHHIVFVEHDGIISASLNENGELCASFPDEYSSQPQTIRFKKQGVWRISPKVREGQPLTLQEWIVKSASLKRVERVKEQKQRDRDAAENAQNEARDRDLAERVLLPQFLQACRLERLLPWPNEMTLIMYEVNYCTGVDDDGKLCFETLYTREINPEEMFGKFISGYDESGNHHELFLHECLYPQVRRLSISSYENLPAPLFQGAGIALSLDSTVTNLSCDGSGFLVERAANDEEYEPLQWDWVDHWIDKWAEDYRLPSRRLPEWVLDMLFDTNDNSLLDILTFNNLTLNLLTSNNSFLNLLLQAITQGSERLREDEFWDEGMKEEVANLVSQLASDCLGLKQHLINKH